MHKSDDHLKMNWRECKMFSSALVTLNNILLDCDQGLHVSPKCLHARCSMNHDGIAGVQSLTLGIYQALSRLLSWKTRSIKDSNHLWIVKRF